MYRPDWDQMDLGVPIPELLFNEDLIGNDALAVDLEEHLGNAQHYVQEDDIKREKIDNFFTNFFAVENQLKDEHILPEQSIDNDISLSEVYGDIFYDDIDQHEDSMQGSPNSSASGSMSEEETQALIEDMEEFLTQHEAFDFQEEVKVQGDPLVTDAETEQAEKILDALIHGDVSLGNISGAAGQIGNGLISNISEIVGANGQKIYIVITNDLESSANTTLNTSTLEEMLSSPISAPSPQSSIQSGASSPNYSSFAGDDASDSDWSPASPRQKSRGGRAAKTASSASRKPSGPRRKATVDSYRGIKDKKERKKVQNVHAARRYREKKKTEQGGIEAEEEEALAKNRELKTKLSEMESEVKTLKKLMTELGIVKMLAAKK